MGYVNTEALSGRNLCRRFSSDGLQGINEDRAAAYVEYILNKANFVGVVDKVEVELELVLDSTLRRHIELTTTCTYSTPFGRVLEYFGFDKIHKYQIKACADCADYISTVDYQYAWASGTFGEGPKAVEAAVKFLNTLVKTYNHYAEK